MIRRTPRSTLFPTRRSSDLESFLENYGSDWQGNSFDPISGKNVEFGFKRDWLNGRWNSSVSVRSEEHTSELQSQSNLVCRLLLEKKNQITVISITVPFVRLC